MEQKLLLQDLANLLAEKEGISKRQAETFVRAFFDITEEALLQDNYVKITGFGTAKLVEVSERESVNIHTGERFQIQGHSKVSFTPDTNLRDLINRPFAHFTTITLNDDTTDEELAEVDKMMLEVVPLADEEEQQAAFSPEEEDNPEITSVTAETQENEEEKEVEIPQATPLPILTATQETPQLEAPTEVQPEIEEELAEETEEVVEMMAEPEASVEEEEREEESNTVFISLPPETEEEEVKATETADTEEAPKTVEIVEEIEDDVEEDHEKNFTISTATADIQQTKGDDVTNIKGSILVKTEESNKHSKINYWKIGFLIVAAILLLQLGYWAGQKGLFDAKTHPEELQSAPKVEKTVAAKGEQEQQKSNSVGQPSTAPTPKTEEVKAEVQAEPMQVAAPKPAPKAEVAKPTPQKVDYKKAAEQYQQLPKGTMLIVGTASQYAFATGDNIYRLAKRTYGTKDFAPYIILYNNLDNPDNIPIGKIIKLPKLVEKSAITSGQ